MRTFDFEGVQKAMVAMDWKYRENRVPTVEELRETARRLLTSAAEEAKLPPGHSLSCGGFEVNRGGSVLHLNFVFGRAYGYSVKTGAEIAKCEPDLESAYPEKPVTTMRAVAALVQAYVRAQLDIEPGSGPAVDEDGAPFITMDEARAYTNGLMEALCRTNGWPCLPPDECQVSAWLDEWLEKALLPRRVQVVTDDERAVLRWYRQARMDASREYEGQCGKVQVLMVGEEDPTRTVDHQFDHCAGLTSLMHGVAVYHGPHAPNPDPDEPALRAEAKLLVQANCLSFQ